MVYLSVMSLLYSIRQMRCGLLFFQLFVVVLFTLNTSIPLGCLLGPIGSPTESRWISKDLAFVQFIHSYYSYHPSIDCWHFIFSHSC